MIRPKGPLFTQKHYEEAMRAVRGLPPPLKEGMAQTMCAMFERDNPKFNREKFLKCLGGQDDQDTRP